MKSILSLLLFFSFSISTFAQDLPQHLQKMLEQTKESFVDYSKKSPETIYDGRYDETDIMIFMRIGLIDGYDVIFSKSEINNYKTKLVIEISAIFSEDQLRAISNVGNETVVNHKKAAKFFDAALLFKQGKLKESKIFKWIIRTLNF